MIMGCEPARLRERVRLVEALGEPLIIAAAPLSRFAPPPITRCSAPRPALASATPAMRTTSSSRISGKMKFAPE